MELAINLSKGQGLGNQIFCIAALYKLASILNRKPLIFNYSHYKGESFLPLNKSLFEINTFSCTSKFEIINDLIVQELLSGLDITDHKDFIYSLFRSRSKKIMLKGNLQNEFFIPSKEEILNIFPSILELKKMAIIRNNDLLIHIRGGDYKKTLARSTKNYYLNSLKYLETKLNLNSNKYIVCDDRSYARNLLPEITIISSSKKDKSDIKKANHHLGFSIKKDFLSLIKAKYAIIPASTFSFWCRIFAHTIYDDAFTLAPLNWYGYRLGNNFASPIRYTFKDFIYIDKGGKTYNSHQIYKKKKNPFYIKNIKLNPKIRTIINIIIIKLFKK